MDSSAEEVKESALRENISRKGVNSYYYAHGTKIDGPVWDGKEEPRLLEKSDTFVAPLVLADVFESYSWLDEKKHVKIYVDFNNAFEVDDACVSLVSTPNSIEFRVLFDGKEKALIVNPLNAEVESVSFRKKTDKFILVVKKTVEASWYQLKKT
jgi:hypothetical protein